jgi:hypothetical protein
MTESTEQKLLRVAKEIAEKARTGGVHLKLFGGLAVWEHCPNSRIVAGLSRELPLDIDFVADCGSAERVVNLMVGIGFASGRWSYTQMRFAAPIKVNGKDRELTCDVQFGELNFSHCIAIRKDLRDDHFSIPLVELLLSKLQIHEFQKKDLLDVVMLLREHEFGQDDVDKIDSPVLLKCCNRDWGLSTNVTENLVAVSEYLSSISCITNQDKATISARVEEFRSLLTNSPKTWRWKMRALIGRRRPWWRTVEYDAMVDSCI